MCLNLPLLVPRDDHTYLDPQPICSLSLEVLFPTIPVELTPCVCVLVRDIYVLCPAPAPGFLLAVAPACLPLALRVSRSPRPARHI